MIVVAAFGLLLSSCTKPKLGDIHVVDYKIRSIVPHSLRAVSCDVALDLQNNGPTMVFTDVRAELYRSGSYIGAFVSDSLAIPGRTTTNQILSGTITLDPSVPLKDVIGMARNFSPEEFVINASATVAVGKIKVNLKKIKIPLEKLTEK